MRLLSLLFLVAFLAVVGLFAWYNLEDVTLRFFDWQLTLSLALLIGIVYVIGMLSGWSVIGMVRGSVRRLERQGQ